MGVVLYRALLLLAIMVAVAATPRTCSVCTFINDDFTITACLLCSSPLASSPDAHQPGTSASRCTSVTTSTCAGHHVCGWRLNNGTICPYTSDRASNIQRHQDNHAEHSEQRATEASRAHTHANKFFSQFKRPRTESERPRTESATAQARTEIAGSTSSTRQPQPAQSNTLSPTSSTRTAPPLHTATFAEFECPVRERQIELDGGNGASFEAEQQQQHYQHQTTAVEFMTGIATAAAQAATASLEALISAVI